MMERSSLFISLSGWSGISAGICALIGAWFASRVIGPAKHINNSADGSRYESLPDFSVAGYMGNRLFTIAVLTFTAALVLAFVFTYLRSKKKGFSIWGRSARRLLLNVSVPMAVGGVYLLHLMQAGTFGLIAPGCLIFYGLALLNASKYTLSEIRYLGYGNIILGIVNCWFIGYGLFFWAVGFGVLHIVYGALMWWKYERAG